MASNDLGGTIFLKMKHYTVPLCLVILVCTSEALARSDGTRTNDLFAQGTDNATTSRLECPPESTCVRLLQCPDVDRMAIVRYLSRPPHLRPPTERRWESSHWPRCALMNGEFAGICCRMHPVIDTVGTKTTSLLSTLPYHEQEQLLRRAEKMAYHELETFLTHGGSAEEDTPATFHGELPLSDDVLSPELVRQGLQDVLTWQALNSISNGSAIEYFQRPKRCLVGPACDKGHSRYRRFDGRCNNIEPGGSLWGAAGYPMERLLPPAYGDGIWAPRIVSHTGRYLPSARKLSSTLFADLHHPHATCNVLFMQFGQFLAHDFSRNKPIKTKAKCCTEDGTGRVKDAFPGCMPIPVSSGDDFYSQHGVRCLHFMRSAVAPTRDCHSVGHGRQLSAVSHFIDGSAIYGTDSKQSHALRALEGGRLKSLFHRRFHNELPPLDHTKDACDPAAEMCFLTGDGRSNQLISLVAVHTLFLREHNRLARQLQKLNPHWSDRTLFQEARRIVIAQLQHIAYGEYLPRVVGPRYMSLYRLHLPVPGTYSEFYSPHTNPSVSSEFTVAAFRFGHSTVPSKLDLQDGPVETWLTFLNPTRFRERTFYDDLLWSLQRQPMQSVDELFSTSLTRFLNVKPGKQHGVDLAAINIQRGRDHAVRPYNDYRRLSGRPGAYSFDDFGPEVGSKLRGLYPHPDDVDLYVGGILEPPVDGGVVGETFAELIADQFAKFQRGDRYFYSNGPDTNPGHFTVPQLKEIQRVTLASLICANAGDPHQMHVVPDAFALPHEGNRPIDCTAPEITRLDLSWWRD
ncbi:chorion peroxidase-like [Anopheles arabiensis]|uniref:chorion peroxidase-like n=1 Tax=Anopheles arabiensis TaxID=7173 RepID=UPI001AADB670|nr:chorion peroxidase-like [Anopheles arabiensis]